MYLLCFEDIQTSHSGALSAPKSTKKQLWNPCCHWVVQMTKKSPTWIQSWSQGVPKSIKNLRLAPKVSCWVSLGASGSTIWCPGTPKFHPGTSKCTCQVSEKLSQVAKMEPRVYQIVNQLLARWRGVNNWIHIYIYIHTRVFNTWADLIHGQILIHGRIWGIRRKRQRKRERPQLPNTRERCPIATLWDGPRCIIERSRR